MEGSEKNIEIKPDIQPEKEKALSDKKNSTELTVENPLAKEAKQILAELVVEQDPEKTKDLTYLFNINQNKKTMVRLNKLNELQDALTDQAVARVTNNPDELSNKDLMDGLKITQDLISRGLDQINGIEDQPPLIQITSQPTAANNARLELGRESRERVKNIVLELLAAKTDNSQNIVDVEAIPVTEEKDNINSVDALNQKN